MMECIKYIYSLFLESRSVSIDSRTLKPGDIFFALKGQKQDGNTFARDAINKGAIQVIVDDPKYYNLDKKCILVKDSLFTLQNLASYHRSACNIPILAVTGSSGKTTTKNLIAKCLETKYDLIYTQGNLNNHIGVPLTLLRITNKTEIAVIEIGTNNVGEIEALCKIASPTHGLITNTRPVHIEGLKNLEGVIREKTALYRFLATRRGTVFVNDQESDLKKIAVSLFSDPVFFQSRENFSYLDMVEEAPFISYKSINNERVHTNLLGAFQINNVSAALCIANYFGIDTSQANKAVASYTPTNNRSQIIQKNSNTIILDAYNANLDSIQQMIEACAKMPLKNKVLILGAMREIGTETITMHNNLGKFLSNHINCTILLCGEEMKYAQQECKEALHFYIKQHLEEYVKHQSFQDSAILIKGSRYWQLETLIDII